MSDDRLRRLVLMLSSDNDNEVLSAARLIGRTLQQNKKDWHWLADHLTSADAALPPPVSLKWRSAVEMVLANYEDDLSDKEVSFLWNMAEWRRRPTEKQAKWLTDIFERFDVEVNW